MCDDHCEFTSASVAVSIVGPTAAVRSAEVPDDVRESSPRSTDVVIGREVFLQERPRLQCAVRGLR
jgi:hypothetical protein